jgi:hypothetical protein
MLIQILKFKFSQKLEHQSKHTCRHQVAFYKHFEYMYGLNINKHYYFFIQGVSKKKKTSQ